MAKLVFQIAWLSPVLRPSHPPAQRAQRVTHRRSRLTSHAVAFTAESEYTSTDYSQTLSDAGVLQSVGSVGDAYDNALAESFLDSFKTELITERTWRTRSALELAVVEYVAWFNDERLHEALGDRPPREIEDLYAAQERATTPIA